jgi:uncharacterized delta-60 repeat protein
MSETLAGSGRACLGLMGQRPLTWRRGLVAVVLILLLASSSPASAQGGSLDPTFGGDGKVTTNFTPGADLGFDVTIQDDGKIIAVGGTAGFSGTKGKFALARYKSDGTLDISFGGDGRVTTNLTSDYDAAFAVAIQPADGKIVVAGVATGDSQMFAVARYHTDGTLDTSFGSNGRTFVDFSAGTDFAYGLAIQADGRIVVAGRAGGSGGKFALARFEPNGTEDETFSEDGRVTTNFTAADDLIDTLAIQSDGKLVAAGTADYDGGGSRVALARYEMDGDLDPTFDGDGKVTTTFPSDLSWGFALAIQPTDEKIVAGGQAGHRLALIRYETDGSLDPTFSGDGKLTTNFTPGTDYTDEVVIHASDGKIVAVGSADYFGDNARFAMARFETDGDLDPSFDGDGKVTTNFTPKRDLGYSLAIQDDGKYVAAGASGFGGPDAKFALSRYLAT